MISIESDMWVYGRDTEFNPFWKEWLYPRVTTKNFKGEVETTGHIIGINIEG